MYSTLKMGSNIHSKDEESGSTALHRALFYGCIDCAVLLLRYGASLELTDNDFRNPLQYVCKPTELEFSYDIPQSNEILVWGTNKNHNLGIGNEQGTIPQSIDTFRREDISIESLSMSAYHSLFIDMGGNVYSVGHGKGGRLGTGSEDSLPVPKRLKLPTRDAMERVVRVSASRNHSLFLTSKGTVYTCGVNTDQQLGIQSAPEKSIVLKEVVAFRQFGVGGLTGVIAKDYHSVAFSTNEVYIWGANKGQFGIKNEVSHVLLPHQLQIPDNKKIQLVESNNSAIACYTACKLVLLYHNYKMKTFKTPSLEALTCISLTSGCVRKDGKIDCSSVLKLLTLTVSNCLYIWYEDSMQYIRCVYLQTRQLDAEKVFLNDNQLLILSKGDVYMGRTSIQTIHNPIDISEYKNTYNKKEISITSRIRIDLKRVPCVDRALDIVSDDDFESFAVLQESSRKYYRIPDLLSDDNTFKTLLHEVSDQDVVHDIVFHVDTEVFPAHRFIVFSRSKGIMKAVEDFEDKHVYLNYQGLTAKMFELMLKYIYTNYLLVDEDLDKVGQSLGPNFSGDRLDAINLFQTFAIKFELPYLGHAIQSLIDGRPPAKTKFPKLRRTVLTKLHDVKIICAGDKELYAHKCVLVDRLDYFRLMFSNSWCETRSINMSSVPVEYMIPLIDFLYSGDAEAFKKGKYSESFLLNMIVICDKFFVNKLRKVCEKLVLERITTRKCGEILEFACDYNCQVLEKGCLEYICQNLARILEQRSLEACDPTILAKINCFYRQTYKTKLDYRVITPNSEAISDDNLGAFISDFSVDLEFRIDDNRTKLKPKCRSMANKFAMSKRNYEKEAIQSMKEMALDAKVKNEEQSLRKNVDDEIEVEKQLHSEAKTWMKVPESKKDNRKRSLLAAIKTNEILKEEIKSKKEELNDLTQLSKILDKTQNKPDKNVISPTNRFNVILGDFAPLKGDKLSQKQRKRLSSESKTEISDLSCTTPISTHQPPNAWNNISPSVHEQSSLADILRSPFSNSKISSSSPDKMSHSLLRFSTSQTRIRNLSFTSFAGSSPSTSSSNKDNSFSKILEEERKQKEYYDKTKCKSLVLTQIEETAITDLEAFYNIDNVFDEMIRIERKRCDQTINFAIWQHS